MSTHEKSEERKKANHCPFFEGFCMREKCMLYHYTTKTCAIMRIALTLGGEAWRRR